jgi:hypothetical protein
MVGLQLDRINADMEKSLPVSYPKSCFIFQEFQ